jgi:hypothetical protein
VVDPGGGLNQIRAEEGSQTGAALRPGGRKGCPFFSSLWKKHTTLPSLAYAGIPYQSLGEWAGALALLIEYLRAGPRARGIPQWHAAHPETIWR